MKKEKKTIFNNASSIVKYIENNIDELFKIFFNKDEAIDEYDEPYKNVYKLEINSFLISIENSIENFEKRDIFINENIIKYVLLDNWRCGIDENYDKSELEKFIGKLLKNIYSKKNITEKLKLKSNELDYLDSILYKEVRNNLMFLSAYVLKDTNDYNYKLYLNKKKIDKNKAEDMLKNTIADYINVSNISYKLFKHKLSGELKSIHNNVCNSLNISRNEFVF